MEEEEERRKDTYYGSPDQFHFSADSSKSDRIQENYAVSSNFIAYLKDVTGSDDNNLKKKLVSVIVDGEEPEDVDGIGNESGELESVWQYLDNFYEFGEDEKIDKGKNPLPIDLLDKTKFQPINMECLPDFKNINSAGSIILLEFFTHCCVNCIHSIADVRQVYEDLTTDARSQWNGNELKIISIHSPKFTREKDLESIKSFAEQFQMDYSEVVNDPGCLLWNELGISCWPTLLILGPTGNGNDGNMNLLFTMMGEGHKHVLKLILSSAVPYFRHKLRMGGEDSTDFCGGGRGGAKLVVPRPLTETPMKMVDSILRYPGKVTCCSDGTLLAISDTGNHRILISDLNGDVKHIIGGTEKGDVDGNFQQARFHFPQGVVFKDNDVLIIADTGNHSIRVVNLTRGNVTTLIPHGWNCTIHDNETVHLRSPWDLTFFSKEILLVAAAGNHRVFAYFFESSKLFTSEFDKGTFTVIAGNGKEENRNNAYILKASFAQPSGICVLNHNNQEGSSSKTIFIADSESSSIRCITTDGKGKVSAVIGGAKDPTDLFSYGDEDGKGNFAKLQHPMGVCSRDTEAKIYFVDTYNNKVKAVDINSQTCVTLCGIGTPGNEIGEFEHAKFNEPGGICMNPTLKTLYVADTNNHAIKSINLVSNVVQNVVLKLPTSDTKYDDTFLVKNTKKNSPVSFRIAIANVPENFEGGQWRLQKDESRNMVLMSGEIGRRDSSSGMAEIVVSQLMIVDDGKSEANQYSIIADIFLCGPSSCYKKSLKFLLKIVPNQNQNDPTIANDIFTYTPKSDFFTT